MGKLVKRDKMADWKPRDMEIKINYCKCTLWTFHLAGLVSTYDNCFHFWNVGWGLIKVPVLSRFFDVATYVHRTFVLLNLYVTFIMQWTYVQKLQVCIVKQTFLSSNPMIISKWDHLAEEIVSHTPDEIGFNYAVCFLSKEKIVWGC